MSHTLNLSADEALLKLKEGNRKYLDLNEPDGDISRAVRLKTFRGGQHPYAVILTCSDSRVIPESIFSAGIGDLFVIRVAGNVIDRHQLGSIEYAAEHLGCMLCVVMGHTGCGAVESALSGTCSGYVASILDEIRLAAAGETDTYKACCLNINRSVELIRKGLGLSDTSREGLRVTGAIYHTDTGETEFLP